MRIICRLQWPGACFMAVWKRAFGAFRCAVASLRELFFLFFGTGFTDFADCAEKHWNAKVAKVRQGRQSGFAFSFDSTGVLSESGADKSSSLWASPLAPTPQVAESYARQAALRFGQRDLNLRQCTRKTDSVRWRLIPWHHPIPQGSKFFSNQPVRRSLTAKTDSFRFGKFLCFLSGTSRA